MQSGFDEARDLSVEMEKACASQSLVASLLSTGQEFIKLQQALEGRGQVLRRAAEELVCVCVMMSRLFVHRLRLLLFALLYACSCRNRCLMRKFC